MTLLSNQTHKRWILLGLAALMATTRFHHFGSVTFLPDASLAVFFLAGLYLTKRITFASSDKGPSETSAARWLIPAGIFAFLLLEAGLVDYLAIRYGGVSDWCVTPAYWFLIPTYGVMYLAGAWCARFDPLTKSGAVKTGGVLLAASATAFLISNGSFYLFADRFAEMNWVAYADRTAPYLVSYVTYAMVYCALALGLHLALRAGRAAAIRPAAPKSS
jgi:hypothetical protein